MQYGQWQTATRHVETQIHTGRSLNFSHIVIGFSEIHNFSNHTQNKIVKVNYYKYLYHPINVTSQPLELERVSHP